MLWVKTKLPSIASFITFSESFESKIYPDKFNNKTIGIGRNLDAVGLLPSEIEHFKKKYGLLDEESVWAKLNAGIDKADAEFLLDNDITKFKTEIKKLIPYFAQLPSYIQYVLLDMAFNIGVGRGKKGLSSFKKMIAAIGQFHMQATLESLDVATVELLHSAYPDGYLFDVKTRAIRNAKLLCNDWNNVIKILTARPNTEQHLKTIKQYEKQV